MDYKYLRVRYSFKELMRQAHFTITSKIVYFFGLLIFYFLLRITYITADPIYISWSFGAYTDIGYYASNVKSWLTTGKIITGDWDNRLLFPAYHYIVYGWTKIMGLSFYSLNLMAVIFSLLSMLILTFYNKSKNFKFFILFLTSLNFMSIAVSRIAYLENIALFFLIISAYFAKRLNIISAVVSAVFAGLAVLTKTSSLFIFPAILVFLSILAFTHRIKLWKYYMFCFIYLIAVMALLFYYFAASEFYDISILNYTLFNKTPNDFVNPLKNIINILHSNFFARIPVISAAAAVYIYYFLFEKKKLDFSDLIMFLWLLCVIAQQSLFNYNPLRYYLYFLPPVIFFAAKFFGFYFEFIKKITVLKKRKIVLLPAIYFAAYYFIWVYNRSIIDKHYVIKYFSKDLFFVMMYISAAAVIIWIALKFIKYFDYALFYALISIFLFAAFYQIYNYHYKVITFDMKSASRDIENVLAKENLLAGWFAPQLCLNNSIKSLPSYNMSEQYLKIAGATHLILEGENILKSYGVFKLNYIKSYYISKIKTQLNLYEIIN